MRTLVKTATYGIMHIVITFFVALFVSRDLHIALGVSLLEPFVQIIFFSIHEYFWNKSHPGMPSPHQGCCASLPRLIESFFRKKT